MEKPGFVASKLVAIRSHAQDKDWCRKKDSKHSCKIICIVCLYPFLCTSLYNSQFFLYIFNLGYPALERLFLASNQISRVSLQALADMPSLVELDLSNNKLIADAIGILRFFGEFCSKTKFVQNS